MTEINKKSFTQGVVVGVLVMVVLIGVYQLGRTSGDGSGSRTAGTAGTAGQPAPSGQPAAPTGNIAPVTDKDHIRGNKNASVTLVEYSDFECPFCLRFDPTVKQAMAEYGDKLRIVYRHFPLRSIHPQAQKAAEASECAAEQGKFWEMHDKLFELNAGQKLTVDGMKQGAAELKLNTGKFNDCLDNGTMASAVEEDYQDGLKAGVRGTPASYINGQEIAGAVPYDQIKSIIDSLL